MIVYPLGGDWDNEEEKAGVAKRILALTNYQIIELLGNVDINFFNPEEVVKEIRDKKLESIHLDTLLTEADSKDNLLKWVTKFEDSAI